MEGGIGDDTHAVWAALGTPQPLNRRVQELLPGVRADREGKQSIVFASLQPIAPGLLLIGPAARQIGYCRDVVIDNGLVANGRAEYAITATLQHIEKSLYPIEGQNERLGAGHRVQPFFWLHHSIFKQPSGCDFVAWIATNRPPVLRDRPEMGRTAPSGGPTSSRAAALRAQSEASVPSPQPTSRTGQSCNGSASWRMRPCSNASVILPREETRQAV